MPPISLKTEIEEIHGMKSLLKHEKSHFLSMFPEMIRDLTEIPDYQDMPSTNDWLMRVLKYNVPHGSLTRGLTTVLTYHYMSANDLTEENIRLSRVLGWCVEIMHGRNLCTDDFINGNDIRRGKPSWHNVDNLGTNGINDILLLESSAYILIQGHFESHGCYTELIDIVHDIIFKKSYGKNLEIRLKLEGDFEKFTVDRYKAITKYNTSYFSFYLPIRLAMILAGIKDPDVINQVKEITLEMGYLFQVRNDYLNCFSNGKKNVGTDIQDGKITWLFATALEKCTIKEKESLVDSYGQKDPEKVEWVKELYIKLGLSHIYKSHQENNFNSICNRIQNLPEKLPKQLFIDMVNFIYSHRETNEIQ